MLDLSGGDEFITAARFRLEAARRTGAPFDTAWPAMLERLRRGSDDPQALGEALTALQGTESVWRCAYERRRVPQPEVTALLSRRRVPGRETLERLAA